MTSEELQRIRERYVQIFGDEGVPIGTCEAIEEALAVPLPTDLRQISTFYSGGLLGGISHNAIAVRGPATNIVDETLRLRKSISLPHDLVVLAEPPDSLIVLKSGASSVAQASVIWCSAFDIVRLANPESLTEPDIWTDYYSFFKHLLDAEEEERRSGG